MESFVSSYNAVYFLESHHILDTIVETWTYFQSIFGSRKIIQVKKIQDFSETLETRTWEHALYPKKHVILAIIVKIWAHIANMSRSKQDVWGNKYYVRSKTSGTKQNRYKHYVRSRTSGTKHNRFVNTFLSKACDFANCIQRRNNLNLINFAVSSVSAKFQYTGYLAAKTICY